MMCWQCLTTQRDRIQLTKWIPPLRSRIKSLHAPDIKLNLLGETTSELSEKTFLLALWGGCSGLGGFGCSLEAKCDNSMEHFLPSSTNDKLKAIKESLVMQNFHLC